MIAIVDYGVGNLFSLSSSVQSLGAEVRVTGKAEDLRAASHILLPGVGAFADAMAKLQVTGLVPVIQEEVQRKPLLGICLGMQLLFEKSYEYGEHAGLGLIPGAVCPLADDLQEPSLKVPHIGWNAMNIVPGRENDPLFRYVKTGNTSTTCTATTPKTVRPPRWPPASTASRLRGRCAAATSMAPSSIPKNPAIPACACSRRLPNCKEGKA